MQIESARLLPKWRHSMFTNTGKKIKGLAIIVFVINIVFSILLAFAICNNIEKDFAVVLLIYFGIIALGILLAWISSVFVYAFGQLVDNSDTITSILRSLGNESTAEMKKIFSKEFFYDDTPPMGNSDSNSTSALDSNVSLYVPKDLDFKS